GTVDAKDLVMMHDHLMTVKSLTEEQAPRADLNADGKINAADLTLLKRILLK
ncbi:MAG: dockerin type I repeat-containing protein, partial [Clostridia bacterium]|nr:dockerin type I repeat-containing protein [Clostridia bacterium]